MLIGMSRQAYDFTQAVPATLNAALEATEAKTAIILTAISGLDECKQDSAKSEAVNVTGTVALLTELKKLGIKPVFFSTDYVFDGERGMYTEDDRCNPVTVYGRHKVRTENYLRENFSEHLIIRSSKQVAKRIDDKNLLSELAQKLRAGQKIRCANDNWIAPAFVEDIARITLQAIDMGLCGTFHLAGEQQLTRWDLGVMIADAVGADRSLVEACSINDLKFAEVRPPHCTLKTAKFKETVGFEQTPLKEGLSRLVERL